MVDHHHPVHPGSSGVAPHIAAMLCYVCAPVTSIIFLLIEKEDADVRFHAWQATAFSAVYVALLLGLQILSAIMGMIASLLGVLVGFFIPLLGLGAFILWVVCMVKAYQGEAWRIPVIGDYAAKKAGLSVMR